LADERADGKDGLAGIHDSVSLPMLSIRLLKLSLWNANRRVQHPHLTPEETWKDLFATTPNSPEAREILQSRHLFTPSQLPAHEQILQLLQDNEPDSITIVVIGPMTNVALAAATDTETFLRVKEVVVMGGAIFESGNVSFSASFLYHYNVFAYHLSSIAELRASLCLHLLLSSPVHLPTSLVHPHFV
jgi:hypothetical protein